VQSFRFIIRLGEREVRYMKMYITDVEENPSPPARRPRSQEYLMNVRNSSGCLLLGRKSFIVATKPYHHRLRRLTNRKVRKVRTPQVVWREDDGAIPSENKQMEYRQRTDTLQVQVAHGEVFKDGRGTWSMDIETAHQPRG
jgi:hypothetical protein